MGRKKKQIIAVEDVWINSRLNEDGKYLNNFICYSENLQEGFEQFSRRNIWKEQANECSKDVEKAIKSLDAVKAPAQFFYIDDISLYSIELSSKVKITDDYIFRVRYTEQTGQGNDMYVTEKEAISLLEKRIKNKSVFVEYNGIRERIDFDTEEIDNIITRMCENTSDVNVAQVMRGNTEGEWTTITIFKNFLKKA